MGANMIDRGRGPEIEGTRITVVISTEKAKRMLGFKPRRKWNGTLISYR